MSVRIENVILFIGFAIGLVLSLLLLDNNIIPFIMGGGMLGCALDEVMKYFDGRSCERNNYDYR